MFIDNYLFRRDSNLTREKETIARVLHGDTSLQPRRASDSLWARVRENAGDFDLWQHGVHADGPPRGVCGAGGRRSCGSQWRHRQQDRNLSAGHCCQAPWHPVLCSVSHLNIWPTFEMWKRYSHWRKATWRDHSFPRCFCGGTRYIDLTHRNIAFIIEWDCRSNNNNKKLKMK